MKQLLQMEHINQWILDQLIMLQASLRWWTWVCYETTWVSGQNSTDAYDLTTQHAASHSQIYSHCIELLVTWDKCSWTLI